MLELVLNQDNYLDADYPVEDLTDEQLIAISNGEDVVIKRDDEPVEDAKPDEEVASTEEQEQQESERRAEAETAIAAATEEFKATGDDTKIKALFADYAGDYPEFFSEMDKQLAPVIAEMQKQADENTKALAELKAEKAHAEYMAQVVKAIPDFYELGLVGKDNRPSDAFTAWTQDLPYKQVLKYQQVFERGTIQQIADMAADFRASKEPQKTDKPTFKQGKQNPSTISDIGAPAGNQSAGISPLDMTPDQAQAFYAKQFAAGASFADLLKRTGL